MPIGYGARCKACNSKQRPEIDRRLLAGESVRAVSAWLAEHGEKLGFGGLANHAREHLNVVQEAKARIAEAAPVFEDGVQKVIANVALLDEIASIGIDVARKLAPKMTDGPSTAQAAAFGHGLKEARTAVVDKHELLHGKKLNVEGLSDPGAEELHAKLTALVGGTRRGTDAGTAGDPEPSGADPDRDGGR